MIDLQTISKLYSECLLRECSSEESREYLKNLNSSITPENFRLILLKSPEYLEEVEPLKRAVTQVYSDFYFREPTRSELKTHVNTARSTLKAARAAGKAVQVNNFLGIRPFNLDMDITNQCNLRCIMCSFSHTSYSKRYIKHMPVDKFRTLADQLFHVVHKLNLSYGTEPLLHPNFSDLVKISTDYEIPWTCINTNGLLVKKETMQVMIDHEFHCISFSVDAATRNTYERIRIGGNFPRLLNNIGMVQKIKNAAGVIFPKVHLGFVIMRDNVRELPAFIDLAHDLGATGIDATHLIPYKILNNEEQSVRESKDLCNDMLAEARRRADNRGINFSGPEAFDCSQEARKAEDDRAKLLFSLNVESTWKQQYYCPFPWHFMAIDHDGKVYPCGWWYDQEVMGNIYEQDILTIWKDSRYRSLRDDMAAHKPRDCCLICPGAGMGDLGDNSSFFCR